MSQLILHLELIWRSLKYAFCLQVLREVSHNYPGTVTLLWESISATAYRLLKLPSPDDSSYELHLRSWKGDTDKTVGSAFERCIMAAMKVVFILQVSAISTTNLPLYYGRL